jgi:16S rRNA (adenine(1408)-N(1))-methyltransferase
MDLGTGDGRFVLAHAAAHPDRLVLGVDANAAAMVDAARRASRPAGSGGVPNARFIVSSLDALPAELDELADLVTVHFPWGSLRSAAAGHDSEATARLVRLVCPGGTLDVRLADADRDGGAPIDPQAVAAAYMRLGLSPLAVRPANLADAIAVHSSWGKRLLRHPTPGRAAWWISLRRPAASSSARG